MASKATWKKVRWPFDGKTARAFDRDGVGVWAMKISRGTVYLRDDEHKSFTVSCGSDSERSHSGCFYPEKPTLEFAKSFLAEKDF
jgi:hypothetical protein